MSPKRERLFNLRLSEKEYQILSVYSIQAHAAASEIVRDFIKSLERKITREDLRERLRGY